MKYLPVLLLITFAFALPLRGQKAAASFETGNDFLRQCAELDAKHGNIIAVGQYMRCTGYIQGFLEGQTTLVVVSGAKPAYCYPENVDFGQVRRIVTKFLNDNPDKTHLPVSVLMEKALIDTFPCGK